MTTDYDGKIIEEIEEKTEPVTEKFTLFLEHEATIKLMLNGHEVKGGSTYGEFYGELSCIKNAIEGAEHWMEFYNISKDSDAEIHVVLETYKIKKKKVGIKKYGPRKGQDEFESVGYPLDKKEQVVWNSREGKLSNCPEMPKEGQ